MKIAALAGGAEAKAATGWMTDPAGAFEVAPLIPPLMPASSAPEGTFSGASVYQSPGPSSTFPPAPTPFKAVLIAAVSAAPEVSPEGASTALDGIVPPWSGQ
jgi:hypothetical protein